MTSGTLSAEGDARLKNALQSGERLAWSGQPAPDLIVAHQQGCVVAFAVFLLLGALMMLLLTFGLLGGPGGFTRAGTIFFFLLLATGGLLILKGPAIYRSRLLRETYAVTNRRAILISAGGLVTSLEPAMLSNMKVDAQPDGAGALIFGSISNADRTRVTNVGFFGLRNVAEVEALIRKTLLSPA